MSDEEKILNRITKLEEKAIIDGKLVISMSKIITLLVERELNKDMLKRKQVDFVLMVLSVLVSAGALYFLVKVMS